MLVKESDWRIVCIDKLTYAGNMESLADAQESASFAFVRTDICDRASLEALFHEFRPAGLIHLAAESHVDRSIHGPGEFIQTNIIGTYTLLEVAFNYWRSVDCADKDSFRFHHVSTDEVYGSLGATGLFTENSPYRPNSPYSASKAASDHLVRAWHHTYGLPVVTTNCSNNYGPYQFPEKLIPLMIYNAVNGRPLPVYGKGDNVRDWLYVDDHARALWLVYENGENGATYNVGGLNELTNLQVVNAICELLDELRPLAGGRSYSEQITSVPDRPGHDRRYAIDPDKLCRELGWRPVESFASGLEKTVHWYLDNPLWLERVISGEYRNWISKNYGERK